MDVTGADGGVDELGELGRSRLCDHGGAAGTIGSESTVVAREVSALHVAQAGGSVARTRTTNGDITEPLDRSCDELSVEASANQDGEAVFAKTPRSGEEAAVPEGIDGGGWRVVPRSCAGFAHVFVSQRHAEAADDQARKERHDSESYALFQVVGGSHCLSLPLRFHCRRSLFSKLMQTFPIHLSVVIAALLTLIPFLVAAFWPRVVQMEPRFRPAVRIIRPAVLCVPYVLVATSYGQFRWTWFALYLLLPVVTSWLLYLASLADHKQRGDWRDFVVLLAIGLAVDLRWFEPAWPPHLAVFNKMLLLDAGLYGFLAIRRLQGVGFDLRLRAADVRIGLREWAMYAPVAIVLGLAMGFLHFHAELPSISRAVLAWVFTFFFIAVPEEVFFRGWMQNLLERRLGPRWALITTAILFGLSHFNKRAAHFNWQYVVLAALAGIFYGRAWRQERRVGASAVTHATVDTLWSLWLR